MDFKVQVQLDYPESSSVVSTPCIWLEKCCIKLKFRNFIKLILISNLTNFQHFKVQLWKASERDLNNRVRPAKGASKQTVEEILKKYRKNNEKFSQKCITKGIFKECAKKISKIKCLPMERVSFQWKCEINFLKEFS